MRRTRAQRQDHVEKPAPDRGRGLNASRHAQSSDAGKLQRWPANVKSQYGAEEVYLEAFDPADGQTKIAPERGVGACPRSGQSNQSPS